MKLLVLFITLLLGIINVANHPNPHNNVPAKIEFTNTDTLPATSSPIDTARLVVLLESLAAKEKNPLLKRHFESVVLMLNDTTHPFSFTEKLIVSATGALDFFQHDGAKWETYADGPRPLMMAFKSVTDHKNSFYWLFLPKQFDATKKDYPFYMELHGSGGGYNNNPRVMLLDPLQPAIAGVTQQGYRKEGLFILPWGRGDKGYRDIAETDIFECLKDFDQQFKTDAKRQYLYGFSMGGSGTFHIAQKTMERWAALGMYSAAFRSVTQEEANKFKGMPIWMAWGETESWAINDRLLKDYFINAGIEVNWREVKGIGHNYLGEYQEDLMNWLLKQVKK
ncbi:hypothetical protein BH11BAC3_BH11BAC3_27590 [soil metagenome]